MMKTFAMGAAAAALLVAPAFAQAPASNTTAMSSGKMSSGHMSSSHMAKKKKSSKMMKSGNMTGNMTH